MCFSTICSSDTTIEYLYEYVFIKLSSDKVGYSLVSRDCKISYVQSLLPSGQIFTPPVGNGENARYRT